jgi:hypothetical protein
MRRSRLMILSDRLVINEKRKLRKFNEIKIAENE